MSERETRIIYSPKFSWEILRNGGKEAVAKKWSELSGRPMEAVQEGDRIVIKPCPKRSDRIPV